MTNGKSTWKYNKLLTSRRKYFLGGGGMNSVQKAVAANNPGFAPEVGGLSGAGSLGEATTNTATTNTDSSGGTSGEMVAGIAGLAGQATTDIINMVNNITGKDVKEQANNIVANAKANMPAAQAANDSNDAIMADLKNQTELAKVTKKTFGYQNTGNILGSSLSSAASGAAAGSSLGPWGALGGAVGGLTTSLLGSIGRNRQIKKAVKKTNSILDELNDYNSRFYNERIANVASDTMSNLARNYAAFGGGLNTHGGNFTNGMIFINNGGSHEDNPLEGVPMGVDQEGVPNLVEEGETIFNDYVFSKRLKVPKAIRNKYKLGGPISFADASKKLAKESEERPNDPISIRGLQALMSDLANAQEQVRAKYEENKFAKGGVVGRKYDVGSQLLLNQPIDMSDMSWMDGYNLTDDVRKSEWYRENTAPFTKPIDPATTMASIGDSTAYTKAEDIPASITEVYDKPGNSKKPEKTTNNGLSPTWMRYAPAYASGIMALTDAIGLTNKPDYSEADMVLDAAKNAGTYSPVRFNPVGNYLSYKPFDRQFFINQLNAKAGATRRAIMQNAGLNRGAGMAALLASDYNTQGQMGQLARQAEEYNLNQRQKVEEFSRATNMFNSEGLFKADVANQEALLKIRDSYLRGTLSAAELRQRERQQSAATRSANLSNFINSIGDIGRENFARNMIISDPSKYYSIGANGEIIYKKAFDNLSDEEQTYVMGDAYRKKERGNKASRGGYLTIRRK